MVGCPETLFGYPDTKRSRRPCATGRSRQAASETVRLPGIQSPRLDEPALRLGLWEELHAQFLRQAGHPDGSQLAEWESSHLPVLLLPCALLKVEEQLLFLIVE